MIESTLSNLRFGHYTSIPKQQNDKIIAEYIWVDETGINLRSKSRTLTKAVKCLSDIPEWSCDGRKTLQSLSGDTEILMKPVNYFPDPFRGGDNILVLCSIYRIDPESGEEVPANTNFRHYAETIFEAVKEHRPWFGIEQEYILYEKMNRFTKQPLGWPLGGYPAEEPKYSCSVGASVCYGRIVMDLHYKACLAANLKIGGTNSEYIPGQWEFQIGPCEGIEVGDHMWMARYLLSRITEDLNLAVSFDPTPLGEGWGGSGCHTNFSTLEMREVGGYEHIQSAIEKLSASNKEHIAVYGLNNEHRLNGDY